MLEVPVEQGQAVKMEGRGADFDEKGTDKGQSGWVVAYVGVEEHFDILY